MKKTISLFFTLLIGNFAPAQETFPDKETSNPDHVTYAFVNAKIMVDADETIDKAILVIKDGIILAVGSKVPVPKDAIVLDLKGKSIYPSLIDPYTTYGMPDTKGDYGWDQAVKAETDANKVFRTNKQSADELRQLGFGAVLTFQKEGIIRGSGTVVSLADGKENSVLIRDKAAAMYSLDKGNSSSIMGSIALLRKTYSDAGLYKKQMLQSSPETKINNSLQAFNDLQTLPQILETRDKSNVLRADKIAKEFKMKYIIKGSGNEYQRLDEIKATNCKFIIPVNFPTVNEETFPDTTTVSLAELKHWEMAPANPVAMEKYFIAFAFTTADLKDKKDFWKNLRKAISYGLSEKQALRSLTTIPAELLNVSDKLGKLKTGMIANFIITSGNLFDERTIMYENWIQGKPYKINDLNKEVEKTLITKKEKINYGQVIYPFCEYGKALDDRDGFNKIIYDFKTRYDAILIKHVSVWTNEAEGVLKNRDVYITEGRIVRIADSIGVPKLAFAKIIEGRGKHLTAGIIDENSQIAFSENNIDSVELTRLTIRLEDVINPDDIRMYKKLSEGITAAQLISGYAEPAVIKLRWGKSANELKFEKAKPLFPTVISYTKQEKLNLQAGKIAKEKGSSEEDALKSITLLPAKDLQISNRVGSVKVGKDADLVLWSDNPLSVNAKVEKTIIDGHLYYDHEEELKMDKEIEKERARIIKKMLDEKKGN